MPPHDHAVADCVLPRTAGLVGGDVAAGSGVAPKSSVARAPCLPSAGPLRILLVATLFKLSYRVMRCARAGGAEVYVLGNPGARGLIASRHCRKFHPSNFVINGARDEGLALEINWLARELDVTMVVPGDAPATRALIACGDLIERPCFPLPSLEAFDLLNDKWAFTRLCGALGIRCPPTRLYPDAAALGAALASGELAFPVVAKPLGFSGNQGVVVLDERGCTAGLHTINYRPVLVQDFIAGRDIGASVFCRGGRITAFVAHSFERLAYDTFRHDNILAELVHILGPMNVDGVFNFDMRLTADGDVYYLECNPRFFFKIDLSMMAGINFVSLGLRNGDSLAPMLIPHGTHVRFPKGVLLTQRRWPGVIGRDVAFARHVYSDPLPYLLENARILD